MVSARFSAAVAFVSALSALAAPRPFVSKYNVQTHSKRALPTGETIESYHPLAQFETFGDGLDLGLLGLQAPNAETLSSAAVNFLQSRLRVKAGSFAARTTSVSQTATHVYLHQVINGIPAVNSVANVAIKDNKVTSYSANFINPSSVSATTAKISLDAAFAAAEKHFSATRVADAPTATQYFIADSNEAVLVHVVQVQTPGIEHWYEAYVDTNTGAIVGVVDFVASIDYKVLPIWKQDPTEGLETLTDPFDPISSPNGWHTVGTTVNKFTAGNNAIAYKGAATDANTQTESAAGQYIFAFDDTQVPTTADNIGAAKTNAFYIVNSIHDISYRYGFTEATFNFQNDNGVNGGKGNDRVTISVQDAGGTNNANFATPADGQSGHMNMYLWTLTTPRRDGDLENDIVSHEMTHGITNRMTGGGTGRCLSGTESGGMGEGWSDTLAFWLEQKDGSAVKDFTLGKYVYTKGIRNYPYSTSKTVNPLTYASVAKLNEVHNIGEVWANTLLNVYAALTSAHGWSATARTDPTTGEGNVVFLHLLIDALLLQPCNPTIPQARAAWIQADANRYAGANKCLLWTAFASRGLGPNAANHVDDNTIPDECNIPTTTAEPTPTPTPTSSDVPSSTDVPVTTEAPSTDVPTPTADPTTADPTATA